VKRLGIVGPGRESLAERLVARLTERGAVAVLAHTDEVSGDAGDHTGAVQTGEFADDGAWALSGTGRTLTDTLERLATRGAVERDGDTWRIAE
jgi:molybdopterin-guanine dinucleotide biosynthesis protein